MENIKSAKTQTSNSVIDLFKSEFSSTCIPVYIKSLDKTLEFREITVREQKALTKTQIENQHRPATTYRAFNSLIEATLLTKKVDIGRLTEADRYAILFNLYQTAFLDKPQHFTCEHCKNEFDATIDSKVINENFTQLDIADKVYTLKDSTRLYIFNCNYPTINHLMGILDVFQKANSANKSKEVNQADAALLSIMESIDYTNAFIKSIVVERLDKSADAIVAQFDNMSPEDVLNTIALIPQHIMLDEARGVTTKIMVDFINKINSVFVKQKCPACGEEFSNQLGSVTDFLA